MEIKKGKKFIFPENVNSGYGVWKGITLGYFFKNILPTILIGILIIAFIPPNQWFPAPYNYIVGIVKAIIVIIGVVIRLAIITSSPVANRPNITHSKHKKLIKNYNKRQKLLYMKKKAERGR
ncbi:conjugal transfer protein [Staphylococcus aureus]|uniref:conjugal transfer protein n=1 Tax=Staphylococcus aureus TaxID=1280 RepID=UPI00136632DF|nr:conjugal transfer protein [Staphylococcus aureus]QHK46544.1 conjugal transfer protein [Staphylococcus aureus]